jgi:hypothetical protein
METPKEYYTYAYLREDGTPYYIGKGKGKRVYKKDKNEVRPPKDKSKIIFLKQNLTEEEAFNHEIYMIAVFGRKDLGTGILRNKTDGGEGISGVVRGEEWRRKISEVKKGKTHSEETRRKKSEAYKGKNNPNYGKKHSEETKKRISEMQKGEKGHFYGKTHPKEMKEKFSEQKKGKNNPAYGKKWWNDGCGNKKLSVECPGDGWVLGRLNVPKKLKN